MAKRSAELDQEIRESLARISKQPSLKTPAQLDAEIDAILSAGSRADRHEIAAALGFRYPKKAPAKAKALTGTNLFALKELVLAHGPVFPSRVPAVDYPHLKRCLEFGLAEAKNPSSIQLTAIGRAKVAEALREDLEREAKHPPRENTFAAPEQRAEFLAKDRAKQQAKIDRLERALAQVA